jgi:hypothetical protein
MLGCLFAGRRQKFAFSLKLYLIAGKKFSIREELE